MPPSCGLPTTNSWSAAAKVIHQAVAAAVRAESTASSWQRHLRDHALLLEFWQSRTEGAEHAMAIHMCRSMEVMGLG